MAAFLTHEERTSALWKKLRDHLEKRLDAHRKENDGNLDERKTARLRGRIAEAKYLLSLDQDHMVDDGSDTE